MHSIRFRLRAFGLVFLAAAVLGTLGFALVEGLALTDALYFTVVTIATVGYGDIHPLTQAGKWLAIVLIILGTGAFLGVVANATEMMLHRREREARLEKLNMVIGVFFSEVGMQLIALLAGSDPELERIRERLLVTAGWTVQDFAVVRAELAKYGYGVEIDRLDLADLRALLAGNRELLVRILENPMLLEHEEFTDLLRAVFHLAEELSYRDDLSRLPPSDRAHLAGDGQRAYRLLVAQWLQYMRYLQESYPYLFSLAMRTNPFDREASPIIT